MSDVVHIPVKRSAAKRILKRTVQSGRGIILRPDDIVGGEGLFSSLKKAASSSIGKAVIKTIAKEALPVVANTIGTAVAARTGNQGLGNIASSLTTSLGNEGVKQATGGKLIKGSPEMKAHMARLRAMKKGKSGGSFLPLGG
jgi:hypothetical protein